MKTTKQNLAVQKWVAAVSLLLLIVKFLAYYLTGSVAILTDAMESIVNVVSGVIGLYSLYVAAKPRDKDHPYGHGKAEFISAATEGAMILVAAIIIIYKAIGHLIYGVELKQLDLGIWLIGSTAIVNFIMGTVCIRIGNKNNSLALTASGRHLQTDTFSTVAIIAGLIAVYFTSLTWIDSALAMLVALLTMYTGYRILRRSIAGIMDEADEKLLLEMVKLLNRNRQVNWIDLHNLRVIKYGSILHIDCHLTVPWYLNVHEAHLEVDKLAGPVKQNFGETVELFVHSDGCLPFQCHICSKPDCPVRQHNFKSRVEWTLENVSQNKKHGPDDE